MCMIFLSYIYVNSKFVHKKIPETGDQVLRFLPLSFSTKQQGKNNVSFELNIS